MPTDNKARSYSGRDARQGEIILRTPTRRAVFIGSLIGAVLLALLINLLSLL